MTAEKRREMAEELTQIHAGCLMRCSLCEQTVQAIESALSDAYQLGQVEGLREASKVAEVYIHNNLPPEGERDALDKTAAYSNGTVRLIAKELRDRATKMEPSEPG